MADTVLETRRMSKNGYCACYHGARTSPEFALRTFDALRFEDGYARTWEDDWKDRFVLVTRELPVLFSDKVYIIHIVVELFLHRSH